MLPQRKAPVVAIANTLPIRHGDDGWELSPGGLVTALRPVMETRSGAWVGWDGGTKGVPATLPALETSLLPISLSSALDERPGALAWVHDYHLTLVPGLIRERRPDQPIGFFLHVPWPAPEIFGRLPWRQEILLGMLGADVISFHAERYRDNFVRACARLLTGQGVSVHGSAVVLPDQRRVSTTTAPISIDTAEFRRLATDQSTVSEIDGLTEQFAGRTLLLGVDRLDYTKGIIERCWPWRTCSSRVPVCGRRSRSCRWPYPAGTTCPNTGACGTLWRATSAGSTAGSPSRARTFPCTTCIAACPLSSLRPTTPWPT